MVKKNKKKKKISTAFTSTCAKTTSNFQSQSVHFVLGSTFEYFRLAFH